ncbi:Stomatal closure-related actin-binding protein 1 [Zea mays]|uniref:Stomatal closure-related actin-binding protein 1 n=1 Tax=Zea mays TaxID=4577 RepID=A0A3L6DNA4_MAIZE|nr:Stomatal closure-related actin-binding protein 1 [Zea mays]
MLHCPSKAMDIENEIQVLCDQLAKKSSYSLRLLKEILPSGTTKPAYAPEPHDVGRYTQAEVKSGGQTSITKTAGSVDPAAGLVHYVEALVRQRETGYNVVILQVNGVAQAADSVHILCIRRLQMRLAKEKTIIVKEFYST